MDDPERTSLPDTPPDTHGYTPAQHKLLMDAAAEVLIAAVGAEPSGPVAYFREMLAGGSYLYDARRKYADNALVQDVFRHTEDREVDLEVVNQTSLLAQLGKVGEILHDDEEGRGFKTFLFGLAERVVKAAHGGLFGGRASAREQAFLDDLKAALGLAPGDRP